MDVKFWVELAIVIVLGLISYFMKRELDRVKADNDELKTMTKEREERNYTINKEQDEKLADLASRCMAVETVQSHCKACSGRD